MTAALEGGEWSAARPGRTLPPGKTRYPFYMRLGGPQGRSRRAENLVPTGIRSRTVQPVVNRYTDWATGPNFRYVVAWNVPEDSEPKVILERDKYTVSISLSIQLSLSNLLLPLLKPWRTGRSIVTLKRVNYLAPPYLKLTLYSILLTSSDIVHE